MFLRQLAMVGILASGLTIGCAHKVQKADIAGTANPAEEIKKASEEIEAARAKHVDVLAPKDFKAAQKATVEAQEDLQDGDKQEDILENIAYARGYLNRANETADQRRPQAAGILKARESAITAGARSSQLHGQQLGKLDDDFRSEVDDLGALDASEVSDFQNAYLNLELETIKSNNIGNARGMIQGAIDTEKAKRDAPQSLKQAEMDLAVAENQIAANRNDQKSFQAAVDKANFSATLLVDVLKVAHASRPTLGEQTARGIVAQNRKVVSLEGQLSETEMEAQRIAQQSAAERQRLGGEIADRDQSLAERDSALATAGAAVRIQKAMETARRSFKANEAEAYQKGNQLVIRLKSMKFTSGRSELPAQSLAILAKVRDVTSELNPQAVMVEGHTDSTGTAAINDKLSQQRADAVADYLSNNGVEEDKIQATGFGFSKPIASNKTNVGRSQNRRVDIVITPGGTAASGTENGKQPRRPNEVPDTEEM